MSRITEPHWGRPGHVKPDGSLSTPFADVLRALVKNLLAAQAAADAAQAAADAATTSTITIQPGPGVSVASDGNGNYTISASESSSAVPLSIGEDVIYTVAANTQVLFSLPLTVDGRLVVDGYLAEVT